MGHDHQFRPARASELSVACHPVSTPEAEEIAQLLYGLHGSATRFDTEKDDTFLLDCAARGRFVLKIDHPSERMEELDFQVALMRHIERRNLDLPIPRAHRNVDGADLPIVTTRAGERRVVRLMTFLPGTPLDRAVELVKDRDSKTSDMDRALAAVNALRDRRIPNFRDRSGRPYPQDRPPLVFTRSNAARLLEGVDEALRSVQT